MAFDIDQLTADCNAALTDPTPSQVVRDIVSRAVADATSLIGALGQPKYAEVQRLHVSDDLTILNVVWAPKMTLMPHNHNMWAVIGVARPLRPGTRADRTRSNGSRC